MRCIKCFLPEGSRMPRDLPLPLLRRPLISLHAHARDTGLGGKAWWVHGQGWRTPYCGARGRARNDAAILWLLPPAVLSSTLWTSRHCWSPAPDRLKLENSWLGPPTISPIAAVYTRPRARVCGVHHHFSRTARRSASLSVKRINRLHYGGNVEETRRTLMLMSADADVFFTRSR